MKKLIATALAAGALAAAPAAFSQDLGNVIANILGFGTPTYPTYNYGYGTPAVVAQPQYRVYTDAYGRQFYYDQYGQQVYVNNSAPRIVGYDQWGRPVYGNSGTYAYGGYNSWDRDGDGVANTRDRWPNDPRYW